MIQIKRPKSPHAFAANTYVIYSQSECAVVDPTVPYNEADFPQKIRYILLTHSHFDHILEIDSWCESGAEVLVSQKELTALSDPYRNCYKLFFGQDKGYYGKARGVRDGDSLSLGDTEIKVLELPGHTEGSLAYLAEGSAFVGDTVFAGGGFGRWDLPSGNYKELIASVNRILELPEETLLYPGHGEECTLADFKMNFKTKRLI